MTLEAEVATFASEYPDLAAEWFGYVNRGEPGDYVSGSRYRAWWECSQEHLFAAQIWERTQKGANCPYCENAKHTPLPKKSLSEQYPHLAAQWHLRNQGVKPEQVRPSSKLYAYWACESGHEFQASVAKRVAGRAECRDCAQQGWTTPADKSLAVLYPDVASAWSEQRNGMSAAQVTASTPGLYWWNCQHGHVWTSRIVAQLKAEECRQCHDEWARGVRTEVTRLIKESPAPAPRVPAVKVPQSAPVRPVVRQTRPVKPRTSTARRAEEGTPVSAVKLRHSLRSSTVLSRVFPAAHSLHLRTAVKVDICGVLTSNTSQVVVVEVDTKRSSRDLQRSLDLLNVGIILIRICVDVPEVGLGHENLLQLRVNSVESAVRKIEKWLR